MLGKAAAGSGSGRRRGVHKKLNSMKLINALLSLLLLLLGLKRRLQAGAEVRNSSSSIYLFVFHRTWVFYTSVGLFMILD